MLYALLDKLLFFYGNCRFLLGFGVVTHYVGYNALKDYFPSMVMKPNPMCQNSYCMKRQEEYQVVVCTSVFTYIICFSSQGRRNLQLLK